MPSLVLELQAEALDSSVQIADLLRKALVVARKLKIEELEKWISGELNGYRLYKDVPPYRVVQGDIRAQNPVTCAWMPVMFADNAQAAALSTQKVGPSAAELEDLLSRDGGGQLVMSYSPEIAAQLRQNMNVPATPCLIVSPSAVRGILDSVRTIVLNWALKLEEDGITGEGLSFSIAERQIAAAHTYNIANFFGSVSDSQIQQGTADSNQSQ